MAIYEGPAAWAQPHESIKEPEENAGHAALVNGMASKLLKVMPSVTGTPSRNSSEHAQAAGAAGKVGERRTLFHSLCIVYLVYQYYQTSVP